MSHHHHHMRRNYQRNQPPRPPRKPASKHHGKIVFWLIAGSMCFRTFIYRPIIQQIMLGHAPFLHGWGAGH